MTTLFTPMKRMNKLNASTLKNSMLVMVYGHEKRRSIVWQGMNLHMILRRFIVVRAECRIVKGC